MKNFLKKTGKVLQNIAAPIIKPAAMIGAFALASVGAFGQQKQKIDTTKNNVQPRQLVEKGVNKDGNRFERWHSSSELEIQSKGNGKYVGPMMPKKQWDSLLATKPKGWRANRNIPGYQNNGDGFKDNKKTVADSIIVYVPAPGPKGDTVYYKYTTVNEKTSKQTDTLIAKTSKRVWVSGGYITRQEYDGEMQNYTDNRTGEEGTPAKTLHGVCLQVEGEVTPWLSWEVDGVWYFGKPGSTLVQNEREPDAGVLDADDKSIGQSFGHVDLKAKFGKRFGIGKKGNLELHPFVAAGLRGNTPLGTKIQDVPGNRYTLTTSQNHERNRFYIYPMAQVGVQATGYLGKDHKTFIMAGFELTASNQDGRMKRQTGKAYNNSHLSGEAYIVIGGVFGGKTKFKKGGSSHSDSSSTRTEGPIKLTPEEVQMIKAQQEVNEKKKKQQEQNNGMLQKQPANDQDGLNNNSGTTLILNQKQMKVASNNTLCMN